MAAWPVYLVPLLAALYAAATDLKTRRVPNRLTLPLLAAGGAFHAWRWPDDLPVAVLLAVAFFWVWSKGLMGGGDAKLWMALVLWTPPYPVAWRLLLAGLVLLATAGAQIAWRLIRGRPAVGVASPAAWRAALYAAVLLFLVAGGAA